MANSQKTRKVVTRSPQRTVGIINCRWFQATPIEHESDLEKRFIKSALLCPGVREIRSQPFILDLGWGKYTPDFLVLTSQGKLVIEVKPESKVAQFLGLFDAATRTLALKGLRYYVITEKGIDQAYSSRVATEVYRHGKAQIPREVVECVLLCLDRGEELSLSQLEQRAKVERKVVLHMVARRWIQIHPDDLIEDRARVRRVEYEPEKEVANFEERFKTQPWVDGGNPQPVRPKRSRGLKKRASSPIGPYIKKATSPFPQAETCPSVVIASGFSLSLPQEQSED